jgi:hypothetical protein
LLLRANPYFRALAMRQAVPFCQNVSQMCNLLWFTPLLTNNARITGPESWCKRKVICKTAHCIEWTYNLQTCAICTLLSWLRVQYLVNTSESSSTYWLTGRQAMLPLNSAEFFWVGVLWNVLCQDNEWRCMYMKLFIPNWMLKLRPNIPTIKIKM